MAYIEPNSDLALLHDVPLDPDYENTLYFDNVSQQTNYFWAKRVHTFSKLSYVRRNRGWIRLGWNADQWPNNTIIQKLYDSTYMMFKNTAFENKWFYAFVDKVEYVNNNTVDVQYHIDVLQTWHFDYEFNECFIERQHTTTDVKGENTIPEQLETGPYYAWKAPYRLFGQYLKTSGQFEFTPAVCMVTSFDPYEILNSSPTVGAEPIEGRVLPGLKVYGNSYSGAYYTTWPLNDLTVVAINNILSTINSKGLINGVISIAMCATNFNIPEGGTPTDSINELVFDKPTSLGHYTPRNKKLLTYPYSFLYVSNNQGNTAEYRFEDFGRSATNTPVLRIWGTTGPNSGMLCWPVNYKGVDGDNFDEMLTLTGFPLCSWTYDSFKAWLAQNAGTITASAVGLAAGWATTLASNGMLNVASGQQYTPYMGKHSEQAAGSFNPDVNFNAGNGLIGATLGAVGQLFDHARKPPQANGNGNLNLNYQAGVFTFNFYIKEIKEEYAAIIDDYFDMYGYAVHKIGIPNRAARRCWTYVKTIGCSLHGNFPADDLMAIQRLFNNGIRFWKPTATFGNYSPSVNDNRV